MKKKAAKFAVYRMRESVKNCAVHSMTFVDLPMEWKPIVEQAVKHRFELWSKSWILRELDLLDEILK